MIENRLTCLNTNYQKREGKLWTYTYANNNKAQIDYDFINKKWKNSAMNCEAYSSFEGVSSNHRIVTAKIQLSLRKNATQTETNKHYDWALLNNRDFGDKFVFKLGNTFETLQKKIEKGSPNDEYENFVNAHLEAAAKCIKTKPRTKYRVPWETLAVREKRALVTTVSKSYRKNPTTTNARKLKKAQYQLAGIYLKEQTEYIQNLLNKIRDLVEDRQSRIAWQTINEVSSRKSTAKAKLKAANQQGRIKLWKQHCSTLISTSSTRARRDGKIWNDNKKAHDNVPQSRIINCFKMYKISRKSWKPGEWNWQQERKTWLKRRFKEVCSREMHYHHYYL